jgi:SAM-dependent methyltransferase
MSEKEYINTNRELWEKNVEAHVGSEYYDVESFKKGRCTLRDIELKEIGDVSGKQLLHLMCHFGLDTLSWARRGADATGIDFSPKAIDYAGKLANELGLKAEFVCSNICELKENLSGQFDIVFTSEGVFAWLPDLVRWAEIIAHFLRPGGFFYMYEFHPVARIFEDEAEPGTAPSIRYPYFHSDEPYRFECESSYAVADIGACMANYEWFHSVGDILNSLINAGLRIEYFHEFPFSTEPSHPFLTKSEDGLWRYDKMPGGMPLMFSVQAVKS